MPSFLDINLPENIEKGAQGGPEFNTTINTTTSGSEQRNINWSAPLRTWRFNYGMSNKADYQALANFFQTVRGMGHGFRFRDPADFELTAESIGVGDAVNLIFQIIKTYDVSATNALTRTITKPTSGLQVFIDGILQTITTHYTIDLTTGIITFVTAPATSLIVTITGTFDIPVRFDADKMNIQLEHYDAGTIDSIGIQEIR